MIDYVRQETTPLYALSGHPKLGNDLTVKQLILSTLSIEGNYFKNYPRGKAPNLWEADNHLKEYSLIPLQVAPVRTLLSLGTAGAFVCRCLLIVAVEPALECGFSTEVISCP